MVFHNLTANSRSTKPKTKSSHYPNWTERIKFDRSRTKSPGRTLKIVISRLWRSDLFGVKCTQSERPPSPQGSPDMVAEVTNAKKVTVSVLYWYEKLPRTTVLRTSEKTLKKVLLLCLFFVFHFLCCVEVSSFWPCFGLVLANPLAFQRLTLLQRCVRPY